MRIPRRMMTTTTVALAMLAAPLPAFARVPAPTATAAPQHDARPPTPRRLVIAGAVVGGVGLLLAAVGFSALGGIQAAHPAPGLQLTDPGVTPSQLRRLVVLGHAMEGIGYVGATMTLAGATMLGVGLGLRRRHDRVARLRLVPGYASMAITGRF